MRPFIKAGSDWESLPEGLEDLPDGRECLGDSPGGPGVVGMHSRRAGRTFRRAGSGWEVLPEG